MRPAALWLVLVAVGAAAGLVFGTVGALLGAGLGLAAGFLIVVLRIRALVVVPVVAATAAGAAIGRSVTHILCLPDGCPAVETTAAIVTAVGAFVGVAVVGSLAARSLDEHRAARTEAGPDGDEVTER